MVGILRWSVTGSGSKLTVITTAQPLTIVMISVEGGGGGGGGGGEREGGGALTLGGGDGS